MKTKNQTCDYYPECDEQGEPKGSRCGAPATHVIFWDDERYSLGCAEHVKLETFEPIGQKRIRAIGKLI